MFLKSIKFRNFKNLGGNFELDPKLNFIIAPNGTGKTNFLEGIGYLATGKSFRQIPDQHLVPIDKDLLPGDFLEVSGELDNSDKIAITWKAKEKEDNSSLKKTYLLNGKSTLAAKFQRQVYINVHAPQTIDLVSGSPKLRRDFLDNLAIILDPKLSEIYNGFDKVIRSKNRLLKTFDPFLDNSMTENLKTQLIFWNKKIITGSTIITKARWQLLQTIVPLMESISQNVYHQNIESVDYLINSKYVPEDISEYQEFPSEEIKSNLENKIESGISKELRAGRCLYGAQRDEFDFRINSKSLRYIGSRGQQRLFSLILYLASTNIIRAELTTKPLLLIDDIFSELDNKHKKNTINFLLENFSEYQVFITSPVKSDLSKKILALGKSIDL